MNTTDFNQFTTGPVTMIVSAIVMVLLIALTMRAVINRERAMVRDRRRDSVAQLSYMDRWRNQTPA